VLVIRRGRRLARAAAIRPGRSAPRGYRTGRLVRLDQHVPHWPDAAHRQRRAAHL